MVTGTGASSTRENARKGTCPAFANTDEDAAGNAATSILTTSPTSGGAGAAATAFTRAAASSAVFANAGQVPLRAFSRVELAPVPVTIHHQGQFPVVTLSFNLAPGESLGSAVKAVEQARGSLGLPESMQSAFQGTAAAFQASLANE